MYDIQLIKTYSVKQSTYIPMKAPCQYKVRNQA